MERCVWLVTVLCATACPDSPGGDGSELPLPYDELRGGIVFATSAIRGANDYDLYLIPFLAPGSAGEVPFFQLTSASGNDWQPSASRGGEGIVYVHEHEIHMITTSGRIKKISDTSGGDFKDSLPALSFDATKVAWVREDFGRSIGETGFVQTFIMTANVDGTDAQGVNPKDGVIQDAPVFAPTAGSSRIAWTEFNATTLSNSGPVDYGVFVFDLVNKTGKFACKAENGITPNQGNLPQRAVAYRCFGQHMAWPREDALVLGQDMLEIFVDQGRLDTIWGEVQHSIMSQQTGFPITTGRADGFFPPFPMSVSYDPTATRIVFDGMMTSIDGDLPTLGIFTASAAGGSVLRLDIAGHTHDDDVFSTANHLFSVATPQIIP